MPKYTFDITLIPCLLIVNGNRNKRNLFSLLLYIHVFTCTVGTQILENPSL